MSECYVKQVSFKKFLKSIGVSSEKAFADNVSVVLGTVSSSCSDDRNVRAGS